VLAAVAAALVLVTTTLTPGAGFAFVVPSPSSVSLLRERILLGAADLAAGASPMAETEHTVVALASAVVLVGLLAVVLVAAGAPAIVGGVLLVLWIVPGAVNGADADLLAFIIAGGCWLALLTARRRIRPGDAVRRSPARRLGPAAVVTGAVAIILAIVIAPFTPRTAPITGQGSVSGFFDATGIDQTIALGEQLRGGSSAVMLRYRSDDPRYLRVLTLTDFTGARWVADAADRLDSAPPDLVVPGQQEVPVDTVVSIEALRTRSLPIPFDTAAVDGLPPGWRWNEGLGTVSSEFDDTAELEYTATSLVPTPDRDDLAVAAPWADQVTDALELELPERTPGIIAETAAQITASAVDDYERALAIQEWLRVDGGFVYSVDAPVRDGFDGSGVEALEAFLQVREGYCVHFASAMAVMARTLDIPSRIAIGFAPGDATAVDDDVTEWVVTGDDLHAWPELWFESVGWVPFEPTPGLGLAAADPIEDAAQVDDDEFESPIDQPDVPVVAPEEEIDDTAAAPGAGDDTTGPGGFIAVLLGVVVLLLVPAAARAAIRRARLRSTASAESRWREVVDTARDLGFDAGDDATVRAVARSLDSIISGGAGIAAVDRAAVDRAAVALLRDAVERSRYGPPPGATRAVGDPAVGSVGAEVAAARRTLASLRDAATPTGRMLAVVAPRSMVRAARSGIGSIISRYAGAS
jgi:transglutaminase-like putative cysteine protease